MTLGVAVARGSAGCGCGCSGPSSARTPPLPHVGPTPDELRLLLATRAQRQQAPRRTRVLGPQTAPSGQGLAKDIGPGHRAPTVLAGALCGQDVVADLPQVWFAEAPVREPDRPWLAADFRGERPRPAEAAELLAQARAWVEKEAASSPSAARKGVDTGADPFDATRPTPRLGAKDPEFPDPAESDGPRELPSEEDTRRELPQCGSLPRQVSPDAISTLGDICEINLAPGAISGVGALLHARVPVGWEPTRSKGEMKEAYLSDWLDRCVPGGSADWSAANQALHFDEDDVAPGLFWADGWGYYHGFLLHAIRTVYGYRAVVDKDDLATFATTCKMSGSKIAELEAEGKVWLRSRNGWCTNDPTLVSVDANAWPSAVFPDGGVGALGVNVIHEAFTSGGKVRLCANAVKWRAAAADYYLWWAWRLYDYALYLRELDPLSEWWRYYYVGEMCARCAMTEIVNVAGLLVHELGHKFGNSYHCVDSSDEAVAGGIIGGFVGSLAGHILLGPLGAGWDLLAFAGGIAAGIFVGGSVLATGQQACCQYVLGYAFQSALEAKLGLPWAHDDPGDPSVPDLATGRFNYNPGTVGKDLSFNSGQSSCNPSWGTFWAVQQQEYLQVQGFADVVWGMSSDCGSTDRVGGAVLS